MMPVDAVAEARKVLAQNTPMVTVPRQVLGVLATCVALKEAYRAEPKEEPPPVLPVKPEPAPVPVAAPGHDSGAMDAILDEVARLSDLVHGIVDQIPHLGTKRKKPRICESDGFRFAVARLLSVVGRLTAEDIKSKVPTSLTISGIRQRLRGDAWFSCRAGVGYTLTPAGLEAIKEHDQTGAA